MYFYYFMDFFLLVFVFSLSFFHMRCPLHRYRFVELHYRRKGRNDAAKTQTVVIFLPDVRSCVPTRIEWDEMNAKYKQHFDTTVKKGGEVGDNNCGGGHDDGDDGSAEIDDGATSKENGSSAVGEAVHETSECDKPVTSDGDREKIADGESTAPNQKALQRNCYFYFLLLLEFRLCPENVSKLGFS